MPSTSPPAFSTQQRTLVGSSSTANVNLNLNTPFSLAKPQAATATAGQNQHTKPDSNATPCFIAAAHAEFVLQEDRREAIEAAAAAGLAGAAGAGTSTGREGDARWYFGGVNPDFRSYLRESAERISLADRVAHFNTKVQEGFFAGQAVRVDGAQDPPKLSPAPSAIVDGAKVPWRACRGVSLVSYAGQVKTGFEVRRR